MSQHTLSLTIDSNPAVLERCIGIIRRVGFRIESLLMSVTEDPGEACMTVAVQGEAPVEHLQKQLEKQMQVIKVSVEKRAG